MAPGWSSTCPASASRPCAPRRRPARVRVGEQVTLHTSLVVREDSLTLYAFGEPGERDCFELVQSASGIGPKIAQAVVSVFSPEEFRAAVAAGNITALTRVPGIGAKGAQRLVLELKDKVNVLAGSGGGVGAAAGCPGLARPGAGRPGGPRLLRPRRRGGLRSGRRRSLRRTRTPPWRCCCGRRCAAWRSERHDRRDRPSRSARPPRRPGRRVRAAAVLAGRVRRPAPRQRAARPRAGRRPPPRHQPRPRPALRAPGPRQDHPRADHRRGDGCADPDLLRPGHPARRRPGRDPLRAHRGRGVLPRRDPPHVASGRGDALPGHGGLPGRRRGRQGRRRDGDPAGDPAVHPRRRHHQGRPAARTAARPLRLHRPARLLRRRRPGEDPGALRRAARHPPRPFRCRGDRLPLPRHAPHREPAAAPRPRLRPGEGRRRC